MSMTALKKRGVGVTFGDFCAGCSSDWEKPEPILGLHDLDRLELDAEELNR